MLQKTETKEDSHVSKRLTPMETDVARRLQGDIPIIGRPFQKIAEDVGLTEEQVLAIADNLRKQGIIRKFGAIVRHQLAGYTRNTMVVWAVPPDRLNDVGKRLASFSEITHCYERRPAFEGKYTLFTMVHFRKDADVDLLGKIAATVEVVDYKLLRSVEEFKKISMEYF
jgi:DNA-binding Lrp family transcriptional regulator